MCLSKIDLIHIIYFSAIKNFSQDINIIISNESWRVEVFFSLRLHVKEWRIRRNPKASGLSSLSVNSSIYGCCLICWILCDVTPSTKVYFIDSYILYVDGPSLVWWSRFNLFWLCAVFDTSTQIWPMLAKSTFPFLTSLYSLSSPIFRSKILAVDFVKIFCGGPRLFLCQETFENFPYNLNVFTFI